MNSVVIVRYAEIGLKGNNRVVFERKLVANIYSCLDINKVNYKKIIRPLGRIMIETDDSCLCLKTVFGISSFSQALNAGSDLSQVRDTAFSIVRNKMTDKTSFGVFCQRLDKNFPLNSQEFCREVGGFINDKTNARVDLTHPDVPLFAEIIEGCVYLFTEYIGGPGGLPLGIEGGVLVFVDSFLSLLSALWMMKRGCRVFCFALKDINIDLLNQFSYGGKISLRIVKDLSEINEVASRYKAKAFIVSDLLNSIKEYPFTLPIYRPLVGLDKKEIEEKLDEFRQRVCQEV
jgi:thiamine biosynthesis protein ThiI